MTFYCTLIQENTSNQAVLFNTVDKMLNCKAQNKLPSYDDASCLANKFADFFVEKIQTLKNNISPNLTPTECSLMLFDVPKTVTELHEFGYISKEELAPLLCRSVGKSCVLDPIPGSVLRDCIEELLPIIARIVNLSLQSAVMPHDLKEAVLKPKIKKDSLDSELFSNFRPVSNIRFLAKAIEKAVAYRLSPNKLKCS